MERVLDVSRAMGARRPTEAAKLAIRFGFERLGLGRIEGDPALDNVAAHKVLEKVGRASHSDVA